MPLKIRMHTESKIPIEVDSLKLEAMRELSCQEIANLKVYRGNQQVPCGEFFAVSGSAHEDNTVVWEGNLRKVKYIGSHLSSGSIHIEGDVGMHLGAEMSGGEIVLHGNADDWLGAQMSGGQIHVHGDVGDLAVSQFRSDHIHQAALALTALKGHKLLLEIGGVLAS